MLSSAGWYYWGSVALSTPTPTSLGVSVQSGKTAPGGLALLEQTSATTYDLDGNVLTTTDALNNETQFAYDHLGRQITVTQPEVDEKYPVTQTIYDADGNISATIDPLERVTASYYDDSGQVTAGYQGQVLGATVVGSSAYATFSNVSPNGQRSYDVYVRLGRGPRGGELRRLGHDGHGYGDVPRHPRRCHGAVAGRRLDLPGNREALLRIRD